MLTRVETVNETVGFIGEAGSGKTIGALKWIYEMQQRRTVYVIAVDANHDLPLMFDKKIPDVGGKPTGVRRYATATEARAGISADGRGIHAITTDDATPAIHLAVELARSTFVRDRRGVVGGIPVVLFIDEISLYDQATEGKKLGPDLKMILNQRRHKHVMIVYGTQSPTECNRRLFRRSTQLHMFRMEDGDDRAYMRKGGVPEFIVNRLWNLEAHRAVVYHRGG